MKKPAWRPCWPARWRDDRPHRTAVGRLDGLPPLRDDQAADVLLCRRVALPVLRRVLRWRRVRDDAEGLADQAAVEAVLTYRPGPLSLASWAHRVARFTALCAAKADGRHLRHELPLSGDDARGHDHADGGADEAAAEAEARADLETLIAATPAKYRGAFRAAFDGRSLNDWATAEGIASATAWRAVAAARAAIAARLTA